MAFPAATALQGFTTVPPTIKDQLTSSTLGEKSSAMIFGKRMTLVSQISPVQSLSHLRNIDKQYNGLLPAQKMRGH